MLSDSEIPESLKAHIEKESKDTQSPGKEKNNQKEETTDDSSEKWLNDDDDIEIEEGIQKELNLDNEG